MTKRHARKRTVSVVTLCVAIVGALTVTAVAQSQRFPDVPPDHEAYEAVEWAAEVGVTIGYGDGTFKPFSTLSRNGMTSSGPSGPPKETMSTAS